MLRIKLYLVNVCEIIVPISFYLFFLTILEFRKILAYFFNCNLKPPENGDYFVFLDSKITC